MASRIFLVVLLLTFQSEAKSREKKVAAPSSTLSVSLDLTNTQVISTVWGASTMLGEKAVISAGVGTVTLPTSELLLQGNGGFNYLASDVFGFNLGVGGGSGISSSSSVFGSLGFTWSLHPIWDGERRTIFSQRLTVARFLSSVDEGSEIFYQGAMTADITQDFTPFFGINVAYTHYLYTSANGAPKSVPRLLDATKSPSLSSILVQQPDRAISGMLSFFTRFGLNVDCFGSITTSTAVEKQFIYDGGLKLSYTSPSFLTIGVHGNSTLIPNVYSGLGAGVDFGVAW